MAESRDYEAVRLAVELHLARVVDEVTTQFKKLLCDRLEAEALRCRATLRLDMASPDIQLTVNIEKGVKHK